MSDEGSDMLARQDQLAAAITEPEVVALYEAFMAAGIEYANALTARGLDHPEVASVLVGSLAGNMVSAAAKGYV